MKRMVTLGICLAVMLSATMNAAAADGGTKSNAERVQALKDAYGFTHYGAYAGNPYEDKKPMDKATEAQALTAIEKGFALMGTGTTKKIYKPYADFPKGPHHAEFRLFLYDFDAEWGDGTAGRMSSPNSYHSGLQLHATPAHPVTVETVVHETMHAFDCGTGVLGGDNWQLDACEGREAMQTINGEYRYAASVDRSQYLDFRASQNAQEDFAYTATDMVMRGGENPCKLSKDTKLYKKYVAAYQLLLAHFGEGSNIVKRSAAFLGR